MYLMAKTQEQYRRRLFSSGERTFVTIFLKFKVPQKYRYVQFYPFVAVTNFHFLGNYGFV